MPAHAFMINICTLWILGCVWDILISYTCGEHTLICLRTEIQSENS